MSDADIFLPEHCWWLEYPSRVAQAQELAQLIANSLLNVLEAKPHAMLVVPGGATPQLFLQALNQENLPWEKVRVSTTDERCVPENSPESNLGMVKKYLPNAHSVSLEDYPFDIDALVLGMGADGHVASLFPGDAVLKEKKNTVLDATTPVVPHQRRTLTFSALLSVPAIHLLITGVEKRAVLEHAARVDDCTQLPVCGILHSEKQTPVMVHYAD